MKSQVYSVLLLLILATIVKSQAPTTAPVLDCSSAVLTQIKTSLDPAISSIVLTTPQAYTGTVCGLEWSNYKTCCDATKIESAITKQIEELKSSTENFFKFVTKLEALVLPRIDTIRIQFLELKTFLDANKAELITASKLDSTTATIATSLAAETEKLLEGFEKETYAKEKEAFEKGLKPCFEATKQLRSSSMCAICSGRGSSFLDGNNIKIGATACLSIVKECRHSFYFMFKVNQLNKLMSVATRIKDAKTSSTTKVTLNETSSTNADGVSTILGELKTAASLTDAALTFDVTVQNICKKLLVLRGTSKDIEGDKTVIETAVTEAGKDKENLDKLPAAERTALDLKVTQRLATVTAANTQLAAAVTTKIGNLSTAIATAQTSISGAKTDIDQAKTELATLRTNLNAASTVDKEAIKASIKTKQELIDAKNTIIVNKQKEIMGLVKEVVINCKPEIPDCKTKLPEKVQAFTTATEANIKAAAEENLAQKKMFSQEVTAKLEQENKEMRDKQELIKRLDMEFKNLMVTFNAYTTSQETKIALKTLLIAKQEEMTAKKAEIATNHADMVTKLQTVYTNDSKLLTPEEMKKIQAQMAASFATKEFGSTFTPPIKPTRLRILAGETTGVSVGNDDSGTVAQMPQAGDGTPVIATTIDTSTAKAEGESGSHGQVYTVCLVAILFVLGLLF